MIKQIDPLRLAFLLTGFCAAGLAFWFGDPLVSGNVEALKILVTAFSILAGIVIAIIAILGDPAGLYSGSWRVASAHRRQIKRRLRRFAVLFYLYLIVIGLTYAAVLAGNSTMCSEIARWAERLTLSAGVGAFVWSFVLPVTIINAHMKRLDEEVKKRRE